MRAVASRWGGGCPGHRTPRPDGSPSPPPVCAGTNRARGGGPGAESRDRAGRLVARAAIASGSRSGSPAGRRLAVSASAARRVTPTPPSAGGTQRPRGGRTTRRRSRLPGHRAARASPASAPWVRRLPDRSAARAAGRCPAGLTRHIIRPDEGGWGGWPIEDLPTAPATPSMPCSASVQPRGHDGLSPAPRTRRPPTGSSHHAASGTTPTVESRCCPQDVEEEGTGPAGPTNVAPRSRRLRPAPRRRRAVSTAAATGGAVRIAAAKGATAVAADASRAPQAAVRAHAGDPRGHRCLGVRSRARGRGAAGRRRPAFGQRSRCARLIALHGREPPVLPVYA